jgi:hypothetical protein
MCQGYRFLVPTTKTQTIFFELSLSLLDLIKNNVKLAAKDE